jgi:hypothetical protein
MQEIHDHGYFGYLAQQEDVQTVFSAYRKLGLHKGETRGLEKAMSQHIEDPDIINLGLSLLNPMSQDQKRKTLMALLTNTANPLAVPVLASTVALTRLMGVNIKQTQAWLDDAFEGTIHLKAGEAVSNVADYPSLRVTAGSYTKGGLTIEVDGTDAPEGPSQPSHSTAHSDDGDILTVIVHPSGGGFLGWLKKAWGSLKGGGGSGGGKAGDPFYDSMMDVLGAAYAGAQASAFMDGLIWGTTGTFIGGVAGSPGGPAGALEGAAIGGTIGTTLGSAKGAITGGLAAGAWRAGEIILSTGTNFDAFPDGRTDSEQDIPLGFPMLGRYSALETA